MTEQEPLKIDTNSGKTFITWAKVGGEVLNLPVDFYNIHGQDEGTLWNGYIALCKVPERKDELAGYGKDKESAGNNLFDAFKLHVDMIEGIIAGEAMDAEFARLEAEQAKNLKAQREEDMKERYYTRD